MLAASDRLRSLQPVPEKIAASQPIQRLLVELIDPLDPSQFRHELERRVPAVLVPPAVDPFGLTEIMRKLSVNVVEAGDVVQRNVRPVAGDVREEGEELAVVLRDGVVQVLVELLRALVVLGAVEAGRFEQLNVACQRDSFPEYCAG